ncbi:hypothetical protein [Streptomyces sp. NBC_00063]|uniref:hypothetical protein n=1 Tax=Streptomyces sp. NBC_00063 TaxID=2975638 RepID=UPI00224E725B|nr:hypothetical protein [Streptomyces sp. NBC_00063]MCX5443915.1 hypothetical protein [Streptomyces sp. NBC_00063]
MHNPNRPLISSAATGISGIALALIGAPWWLTAVAFTCFALGLLVTAIQSVFPQDSAHRLAWWRARWHHQQRRHNPLPAHRHTRQTPGPRPEAPDRHGE